MRSPSSSSSLPKRCATPGDVDPQAVGRVGRHHRRIADGPARQLAQAPSRPRPGVASNDMQLRRQGLRLREGHAGVETLRPAPSAQAAADERGATPRRARSRGAHRGGGSPWPAPDPIGRPGRQVERDDPSHRRPPESRNGVRRRGSAGVRHASGRGRARRRAAPGTRRAQMRQRVTAAVGRAVASFSATFHQRRSVKAVTPDASAASCSRREAVRPSRVTSPTTAARPFSRRPSSMAGRTSRSRTASA